MGLNAEKFEVIKHEIELPFGFQRGCCRNSRNEDQCGFTLVELVTVMVIVGILAVAVIPRFSGRGAYDDRAFRDQVVSTLRYAQKLAIAQRRFVCVTFTANSIALASGTNSNCSAGAGAVVSPSGVPYPLVSNQSGFAPLPANFSFDCLGRPRSTAVAAGICGNTFAVLAANLAVQVDGATPITIWQETGYVQ